MPEENEINLIRTDKIDPLYNDEYSSGGRKEHHKKKEKEEEENKDHFGKLTKEAELANELLKEKKIPYRFFIFKENDNIYIDFVLLDSSGEIKEIKEKNITHEKFYKWMKDIQEGEGLLIDDKA